MDSSIGAVFWDIGRLLKIWFCCPWTISCYIGRLFLNLVLFPVDNFLRHRTTFENLALLPVDNFLLHWTTFDIAILLPMNSSSDKKTLPSTWVCGKWGWRKWLNISNFIVLLFRLTETFWTLVSNWATGFYVGGRSGRGVSNAPPDHKPFPLDKITSLRSLSCPTCARATPAVERWERA